MAIAGTLKHSSVLDLEHDPVVKSLIRNIQEDVARRPSDVPTWNLALVLMRLTMAPFEPFHKASDKHLTFKTVFLVALAYGKRRSELHVFENARPRRPVGWYSVTLRPGLSFLSKTQLASKRSLGYLGVYYPFPVVVSGQANEGGPYLVPRQGFAVLA